MNEASLTLPKDLIEGAIRSHVAAAVTAALGDRAAVLDACVQRVLTQKVDSGGNPNASYGKDYEFIQWVMNKCLRDAITEAIGEEIAKHKETVRQHIAKELTRKNSPLLKNLAEQFATGVCDAAGRYSLMVSVEGKRL